MRERLKERYHLSNYQVEQLSFLGKSLVSELIKFVLMGVFFWNDLPEYGFAVVVLLLMRTSTGGLHCKHFISCFFVSFAYVLLAVYLLPLLEVPNSLQLFVLLLCIIINYAIGPMTGPLHRKLNAKNTDKSRIKSFLFIFVFLLIAFVLPENNFISIGFWVIVLHTTQLIVAKVISLMQKRRNPDERYSKEKNVS